MTNHADRAFLVNPKLDLDGIQDAIVRSISSARAMAALLRETNIGHMDQTITAQYSGALEDQLEQLDLLHDRLWELVVVGDARGKT